MRIFRFGLSFELCFTSHSEPVQVSARGACPARSPWQLELQLLPRNVCSQTLPVGHSYARFTPCRYNLGAFLLLLGPSHQDEAAGLLRSAHAVCCRVYTVFWFLFSLSRRYACNLFFLFGNAGMVRSIGQRPRRHARCASFTAEVHDNPGTKLRLRRIRMKLMGSTFAMSNLA